MLWSITLQEDMEYLRKTCYNKKVLQKATNYENIRNIERGRLKKLSSLLYTSTGSANTSACDIRRKKWRIKD